MKRLRVLLYLVSRTMNSGEYVTFRLMWRWWLVSTFNPYLTPIPSCVVANYVVYKEKMGGNDTDTEKS